MTEMRKEATESFESKIHIYTMQKSELELFMLSLPCD